MLGQVHAPGLVVETESVVADRGASPRATLLVRVSGEVDLLTHDRLEQELELLQTCTANRVVIDVSAMAFCDVHGLSLLMRAARAAAERQCDVLIVGLSPLLGRMWSLLWPGPPHGHHKTLEVSVDPSPTIETRAA